MFWPHLYKVECQTILEMYVKMTCTLTVTVEIQPSIIVSVICTNYSDSISLVNIIT